MKNEKDRIILDATVIEANRGGIFNVQLDNGTKIIARPSGKIQQHLIKIIVGDKVRVEVSPYDMTKGRIIQRIK